MKFIGKKLVLSNDERQFYYDIESKYFLKVVRADDDDLEGLYETTHVLYTRDNTKHILFPLATFFWAKQVAILFPRTSVDLHTYTEAQCMSESDLAFTIKSILTALTYLHSKNYIHCDIKRENVVVCLTSRTPKLIDLEFATYNEPISRMREGSSYGTIIAPEMKEKCWNNSIDFYCLGYMFAELCDPRLHPKEKFSVCEKQRHHLKEKFRHIYEGLTKCDPTQRLGYVETRGFVADLIIDAIDACDNKKKGRYNKYSDEFIGRISEYSEKTSSEIITIDLVQ